MNTLWLSNLEVVAEEERAEFRREMEKYQLVREVEKTRPHQPNWLERRALTLSAWMVVTGERLYRRYREIEPVPGWYQSLKVAK